MSLILWSVVVVGISIVALGLKALVGAASWTETLRQGDLFLIAIGLTANAVAFTGMAGLRGNRSVVQAAVISFGLLFLICIVVLYAVVSNNHDSKLSDSAVNTLSWVSVSLGVVIGFSSILLTARTIRAEDEDETL